MKAGISSPIKMQIVNIWADSMVIWTKNQQHSFSGILILRALVLAQLGRFELRRRVVLYSDRLASDDLIPDNSWRAKMVLLNTPHFSEYIQMIKSHKTKNTHKPQVARKTHRAGPFLSAARFSSLFPPVISSLVSRDSRTRSFIIED